MENKIDLHINSDQKSMKWIEIDESNLCDDVVLAANFKARTFGYKEKVLGYLNFDEDGSVMCDNEHEILNGVTHYIKINEHDVIN